MMFSKLTATVLLPLVLLLLVQTLSEGQGFPVPVACNICGEGNMTITRFWGFVLSKNRYGRVVRRSCTTLYYTWYWYGAPSSEVCKFVQDGNLTKTNCGCVYT
jgi:hypothetical protein